MVVIILVIIIIVLSYLLIRYKKNIESLNKQIAFKIEKDSNVRLTLDFSNKELSELSAKIEELFSKLSKERVLAKQEKKTLDMAISNIAHDIRTPLAISRGYTQQIVRDEKLDVEVLKKIEDNLVIAANRLEMLLEYRRVLENAIKPKKEQINIKELVMKELLPMYDAFNEANFNVELNLDEIVVASDKEILERIVQNIIGNVLKHGKEQMNIVLKREKNKTILEVSNISKYKIEHLERLTNRFYSENLASSKESSGLGLYIVEQLTHALDGELSLSYRQDMFYLKIFFN